MSDTPHRPAISDSPTGHVQRPKRGRPRKHKPAPESEATEHTLAAWLVDLAVPEEPPPAQPPVAPVSPAKPDTPLDGEIQRFSDALAGFDFRSFGTKPRFLLMPVRDVSPSEASFEKEWTEGSQAIPEEIRKNVFARNLIGVAMFTGAEDFKFLVASHGKDFAMPKGATRYGSGTEAGPWLRGIRSGVETYQRHLRKLGIGVSDVVVAIASDFLFGDDFRAALAAFKPWAKANRVVVVAAGFGRWSREVAAEFSDVPPVDLKDVSFAQFFRVVSQSAVATSRMQPGTAPTAALLAEGFKNASSNG